MVCTVHHEFVKCQSCRKHVHVGCFVEGTSAYKLILRDCLWTCRECTLTSNRDVKSNCVKSEATPDESESAAVVDTDNQPTFESKCFFKDKQHLMQHARDHGWICRSGERGMPRCYFSCQVQANAQKSKVSGCTVTFKAKAHSDNKKNQKDAVDFNDVQWCAIDMPTHHDCFKPAILPGLTTRTCQLPRNAYQEIQRLACCKAFNSQSIQQYIKLHYQLTVDVALIYNIGYRARNKLGVGEGEIALLLALQKVRVYSVHSNLIKHFDLFRRYDKKKATRLNLCSTRARITSLVSSEFVLIVFYHAPCFCFLHTSQIHHLGTVVHALVGHVF